MSKFKIFTNGLLKENPILVMLLGMCPVLAVTTMAVNGIGMGIATTFVLVCSNIIVSLLRNIVPKKMRLPIFIVIISGFTTICGFFLGYFEALQDINESLGIFIPLISVNCIILGRSEAFASKNTVLKSTLDGLGMGIGFTAVLILVGSIREILGSGSWMGIRLFPNEIPSTVFFILPAGAFFVLALTIAAANKLTSKKSHDKPGCSGCPAAELCSKSNDKI